MNAPAPKPAADPMAIPQDAAKIERRRREWLGWNRRTLAGAYDKVGKKDPRWDKSAREALEQAAQQFSRRSRYLAFGDIQRPARAAVEAGCDDPLVVYLHHRADVVDQRLRGAEASRRMREAAAGLESSRYPAIRRAVALQLAGTTTLDADDPGDELRAEARRDLDAALALLTESVADDERNEFWEDAWRSVLAELIADYRKLGMPAPEAFERVDAALAKAPEAKVLRLLVRGRFWLEYGGEARTTAPAVLVPEGGFEALEARAKVARLAFEEAWQLRPGTTAAAGFLIDIDKAIGGDRATMELWFDRAMKADGDFYGACLGKLDWLDPKWHGTPEEMIAFGRACRATNNWHAGIPLLLADAHLRRTAMLAPGETRQYLTSFDVWNEIRGVFTEYLGHHPDDAVARSKYAAIAYFAGRYFVAHEQFRLLGDRLTTWQEFPNVPFESLERMREYAAQAVPGAR